MDLNMNFAQERNREEPDTAMESDENYHLYHEPVDTDTVVPSSESLSNRPTPLPPLTPRLSMFPALNSPIEWKHSFNQQMMPTDRSPTLTQDHDSFNKKNLKQASSSNRVTPATFSDRATKMGNDIEDDVYFSYVHRNTIERANHRSRSYHGPKNSCNPQIRDDQSLARMETNHRRSINSTSVTELQQAPNAILLTPSPPIIPFRDHCVRELVETESNYVHALEMIITCFAKPLEILLKREDNQLIFGHIRNFHHIHSVFQADLVKAAFRLFNKDLPALPSPTRKSNEQQMMSSNPTTPTLAGNGSTFLNASPLMSPTSNNASIQRESTTSTNARAPKISTCFLNAREKFLKYGEYCASLSRAQALLDELTSKNETIAAQLDRCQQEANEGKFKLRDLLSLPMQRILKYHLLLAQLIKNTSSSNDDYQGLKRAHDAMVDLGQYINEVKRDTEATQIMNEIEQSILGLNMPPNTRLIDYGRLITDGKVRIKVPLESRPKSSNELSKIKLAAQDTKMKPKRYVFVFDKVMLVCKLSGLRRYQYKEALVLSEFALEPNPIVSNELISKHVTKDKWSFMFNLVKNCDGTTYTFYAKTIEMKQKWVSAIQRAMDNTRPAICRRNNNNAGNHEFLMHTFDKASSCDHCGKLLLGLYYQGYRCRVCFTSVHKKCLSSVRSCGPALPPKTSATMSRSDVQRSRCNEPASPSVQSDCSENGHGSFRLFNGPPLNSTNSVQQMDVLAKIEYNNMERGRNNITPAPVAPVSSSSFRENGARVATTMTNGQRPVSSMINVSLQNSTNQMIQQKRLLRGSTSTPSMGRQPSQRVRAIEDFEGDDGRHEMKIVANDTILLSSQYHVQDGNVTHKSHEGVDKVLLKLSLRGNNDFKNDGVWLFGRNLRTGLEGRFPAHVVETEMDVEPASNQVDAEDYVDSYINFPLSDQPWFNDRMDRDKAQALLEELPHGTFLVRVSPKHHNSYVISLKYNNKVMHMRVYVAKDNQLYLSQNRYFNSLVELVSWYEKNSLIESFNMLDACLQYPYKHRTSC
uniref:Protein vav n=1 Tax=Aceria tosichella TaxID=561515 RepID=A0A6G1SF83_9ACAR